MKKLFFLVAAMFVLALPAANAQKVKTDAELAKLEKADAAIADAKKGAKAATWVAHAKAYADAYLANAGVDPNATEAPTTAAPEETEPDEKDTTKADDDATEAPSTEETTAPTEEKKACKSVIALPIVALVATVAVAFVAKKKD